MGEAHGPGRKEWALAFRVAAWQKYFPVGHFCTADASATAGVASSLGSCMPGKAQSYRKNPVMHWKGMNYQHQGKREVKQRKRNGKIICSLMT